MNGNQEQPRGSDDYRRVLRDHRLLIVLITVATTVAALAYSLSQSPTYVAKAWLSFQDENLDLSLSGAAPGPAPDPVKLAAAGAEVAKRPEIYVRLRKSLGTDEPASDLQDAVSASVDPVSNLVIIEASRQSAISAAHLANLAAREIGQVATQAERGRYRSAARSLQRSKLSNETTPLDRRIQQERVLRLLSLSSIAQPVRIERLASVPTSPASPKPVRNALIAAFLGLILGSITAFARDAFDRRLRSTHELDQFDFPVLGSVPNDLLGISMPSQNGGASVSDEELEPFRILRSGLGFLQGDGPLRSVLVTSPTPEEGKSTVATGLACASALANKRTLLVGADLRRPVLAERLGANPAPGLVDYVAGVADAHEIVQVIQINHPTDGSSNGIPASDPAPATPLALMTSGGNPAQGAELLSSELFGHLLASVSTAYDLVVLDTPPLLPVADTHELLSQVDAILLCVRLHHTTRDQVSGAMAALQNFPPRPMGIVVTGIRSGADNYYGYSVPRRANVPVVR